MLLCGRMHVMNVCLYLSIYFCLSGCVCAQTHGHKHARLITRTRNHAEIGGFGNPNWLQLDAYFDTPQLKSTLRAKALVTVQVVWAQTYAQDSEK